MRMTVPLCSQAQFTAPCAMKKGGTSASTLDSSVSWTARNSSILATVIMPSTTGWKAGQMKEPRPSAAITTPWQAAAAMIAADVVLVRTTFPPCACASFSSALGSETGTAMVPPLFERSAMIARAAASIGAGTGRPRSSTT